MAKPRTNTPITDEVLTRVVNMTHRVIDRGLRADPFLPGILAAGLYISVSDFERRYDYRQMKEILRRVEPLVVPQARQLVRDLRLEWIIIGHFRDVMAGEILPEVVKLREASLDPNADLGQAVRDALATLDD